MGGLKIKVLKIISRGFLAAKILDLPMNLGYKKTVRLFDTLLTIIKRSGPLHISQDFIICTIFKPQK
jgi:hypothetical protein